MANEDRLVGAAGVAAHLGVNKDSISRWIEKKGLPAHRLGRLFRVKLSEVDEWIRSGGAGEAGNSSNVKKKGNEENEDYRKTIREIGRSPCKKQRRQECPRGFAAI